MTDSSNEKLKTAMPFTLEVVVAYSVRLNARNIAEVSITTHSTKESAMEYLTKTYNKLDLRNLCAGFSLQAISFEIDVDLSSQYEKDDEAQELINVLTTDDSEIIRIYMLESNMIDLEYYEFYGSHGINYWRNHLITTLRTVDK